MSTDDNGRRRLELIEYPEGEELIDHKGRSKPIYKPSSPRPNDWRPGRAGRLLLGLFPGLRLMVTRSVPAGLPYAILGLITGLGALLVALNWPVATETIRRLHIQPRWILIRAGAVLVLVVIYELLRLGAALEERPRGLRTPRCMAALVLPSFAVVFGAPVLMGVAPRLLEAAWFSALVVGFGAVPAAVACWLDRATGTELRQFRWGAGIALVVVIGIAATLPALGVPLFDGLEGAARATGFRVLPALLP